MNCAPLSWILALGFALTGTAPAQDDLSTEVFRIEADHWLWIQRVARQDRSYEPVEVEGAPGAFPMHGLKSAAEGYAACGIERASGESFIYGPPTSQLILRLTPENHRRVRLIHQTMAAWKAGRTDVWLLDWEPRRETPD